MEDRSGSKPERLASSKCGPQLHMQLHVRNSMRAHLSQSQPPVRIFIISRSRSSVILPPFLRTNSSSSGSILFHCHHVMSASQKRRKIPVRVAALCGGSARLIVSFIMEAPYGTCLRDHAATAEAAFAAA
jgi:hypothetical protein